MIPRSREALGAKTVRKQRGKKWKHGETAASHGKSKKLVRAVGREKEPSYQVPRSLDEQSKHILAQRQRQFLRQKESGGLPIVDAIVSSS
jgi:hypothetical protein